MNIYLYKLMFIYVFLNMPPIFSIMKYDPFMALLNLLIILIQYAFLRNLEMYCHVNFVFFKNFQEQSACKNLLRIQGT